MFDFVTLGLVFISVSAVIFGFLLFLSKIKNPAVRRLRSLEGFSESVDWKKEFSGRSAADDGTTASLLERIILKMSELTRKDDPQQTGLRRSLMQAGYYLDRHMRIFLGAKILIAVFLFMMYSTLGIASSGSGFRMLLIGLVMALVGYFIPDVFLHFRTQNRQEEIARGLPDALDFLVICVEAGLGLNMSLVRVGKEIQLRSRALAQELTIVNQEMRTGISREQALRNLTQRTRVKDLRVLAGAIILSDRLGTNIADTLRAQSDSLRTKIKQIAEEQAAKSGLKMLFPLVFCIFPALFIVILGPAFIHLVNTIAPAVLPQ